MGCRDTSELKTDDVRKRTKEPEEISFSLSESRSGFKFRKGSELLCLPQQLPRPSGCSEKGDVLGGQLISILVAVLAPPHPQRSHD